MGIKICPQHVAHQLWPCKFYRSIGGLKLHGSIGGHSMGSRVCLVRYMCSWLRRVSVTGLAGGRHAAVERGGGDPRGPPGTKF